MKYIAKGTAFGMDCQGDAMASPELARNSLIGFVALSFDVEPWQALELLEAGGPINVEPLPDPEPLPLIEVEEIGTDRIFALLHGYHAPADSLSYSALCKAWGSELASACL